MPIAGLLMRAYIYYVVCIYNYFAIIPICIACIVLFGDQDFIQFIVWQNLCPIALLIEVFLIHVCPNFLNTFNLAGFLNTNNVSQFIGQFDGSGEFEPTWAFIFMNNFKKMGGKIPPAILYYHAFSINAAI